MIVIIRRDYFGTSFLQISISMSEERSICSIDFNIWLQLSLVHIILKRYFQRIVLAVFILIVREVWETIASSLLFSSCQVGYLLFL